MSPGGWKWDWPWHPEGKFKVQNSKFKKGIGHAADRCFGQHGPAEYGGGENTLCGKSLRRRFVSIAYVPDAATLVAVRAVTDAGTVDFNVEKRSKLTPDVAGTDVWGADKQASAGGLEQTAFDNAAVGADSWLHFAASAVAGGVTQLWVSVEYTVD